MKILNLYSGIGGNRKLWGDQHEITAVEYNEEIATVYKDYFPNDKVIIGDAHEFLLKNYMNYDFIWSSPPCPTHSRMRYTCTKQEQKTRGKLEVKYADMTLYQEIILLDKYFEGKYVVENVIPYYQPLIPAKKLGRHLFWANFNIGNFKKKSKSIRGHTMAVLQEERGFDLSKFKMKQRKDTILLNCVDSELALYVLDCAMGIMNKKEVSQGSLF
jgi:DNA (cytosine-5)-methyltransferase 1